MTPQSEGLPADLAERLRRLALAQTTGSRPWPGLDRALRRSQRRRLAGISSLTAVGLLLAGAAYVNLIDPSTRSEPTSPARRAQMLGLAELRAAGYGGPTGGSLAADRPWLERLRHQVQELAKKRGRGSDGRALLGSSEEVLVPWASDLNGSRYALVVYPNGDTVDGGTVDKPQPSFTAAVLAGPAGADADRLTMREVDTWVEAGTGRITSAQSLFVSADQGAGYPGLVLVTGPTVTGVEVASKRHFSADTTVSTQWRPLPSEGGMVWVGQLTPAEWYMSDLRIGGGDALTSSGTPPFAGIRTAAAIAPPGTDLRALECASLNTQQLGASLAERPVISLSTPTAEKGTLAASVLRSPDGPYLVGLCRNSSAVGAVFPGTGDPGDFMAAVETDPFSADARYLVLAPAGASTVEIDGASAPVHNRLATLRRVDANPYADPVTVRALDARGTVIGSVRAKNSV